MREKYCHHYLENAHEVMSNLCWFQWRHSQMNWSQSWPYLRKHMGLGGFDALCLLGNPNIPKSFLHGLSLFHTPPYLLGTFLYLLSSWCQSRSIRLPCIYKPLLTPGPLTWPYVTDNCRGRHTAWCGSFFHFLQRIKTPHQWDVACAQHLHVRLWEAWELPGLQRLAQCTWDGLRNHVKETCALPQSRNARQAFCKVGSLSDLSCQHSWGSESSRVSMGISKDSNWRRLAWWKIFNTSSAVFLPSELAYTCESITLLFKDKCFGLHLQTSIREEIFPVR